MLNLFCRSILVIVNVCFHLCATNKLILDVPSCHLIILFCICVPENTYVIFIPLFMHYCLHQDKEAIN